MNKVEKAREMLIQIFGAMNDCYNLPEIPQKYKEGWEEVLKENEDVLNLSEETFIGALLQKRGLSEKEQDLLDGFRCIITDTINHFTNESSRYTNDFNLFEANVCFVSAYAGFENLVKALSFEEGY